MAAKKKKAPAKKPKGIIDDVVIPVGKKVVAKAAKKIEESPQRAIPTDLRGAIDTASLLGTKKKAQKMVAGIVPEVTDKATKKRLTQLQQFNIAEERLMRARKTLLRLPGGGKSGLNYKIDKKIAGASRDIRTQQYIRGVTAREYESLPHSTWSSANPYNVAKGARRAGVVGGAAAGGFAAGRGNNVPKQKPKPKPSPKGRGGSTKKK